MLISSFKGALTLDFKLSHSFDDIFCFIKYIFINNSIILSIISLVQTRKFSFFLKTFSKISNKDKLSSDVLFSDILKNGNKNGLNITLSLLKIDWFLILLIFEIFLKLLISVLVFLTLFLIKVSSSFSSSISFCWLISS